MPGLDGLALARSIKADPVTRSTRLIILTSLGNRPDAATLNAAGIEAFLTKPVRHSHLLETLTRVISQPAASLPVKTPKTALHPARAGRPGLRVLLAEDNVINQKVARKQLENLGHPTTIVANGREALDALEAGTFDLVLMDCQMPVMDGYEATRQLRARFESTGRQPPVIIALTAHAMRGDREGCIRAGMDDYLEKPVRPEALEKIIEKWSESLRQPVANPMPAPTPPLETPSQTGPGDIPANPPPRSIAVSDIVVDTAKLAESTGDDPELMREILALYLEQTAPQIEQLGAAFASNDAATVGRLSHGILGASSACGFRILVPLLRAAEAQAKSGCLDDAARLQGSIQREFQAVREWILRRAGN
jgi:CheY-like chemotaxis protein/HPt (histidine-containing phosphotransfer) domain-containing protein